MEMLDNYLTTVTNARTRTEYSRMIGNLEKELGVPFRDISINEAAVYFAGLRQKYHNGDIARKTICVRLACFRQYGRFIEGLDSEYRNPFVYIDRPEIDENVSAHSIITLQEADAILEAVKENRMMYLIVAIALRMGLPATQIAKLSRHHLQYDDGYLVISFEKKEQSVRVPKDIAEMITSYVETECTDRDALFVNSKGTQLTIKTLDNMMRKYMRKAGYAYTLKDLRGRAIVDMLKNCPEEAVADYSGLSRLRLHQYAQAVSSITACPAEYTNIIVKNPGGENDYA